VVTIEGCVVTGQTDADGFFRLSGPFQGHVSILFQRADDGLTARVGVNVPGGGVLTFHDLRLDAGTGQGTAARTDVDFTGVVTVPDCAADTVTLVNRDRSGSDTDSYLVHLETSSVVTADGGPGTCETLRPGTTAQVTGSVNDDGSFGEATIRLQR
jgi:hypothetical protein